MSRPLRKPRKCSLCQTEVATLALQFLQTNKARVGLRAVTRRTAQVRAKPHLCEACARTRFEGAIITQTHRACLQAILRAVAKADWNAVILFRSQKNQPRINLNLDLVVRLPGSDEFLDGVDDAHTAAAFNGKTIRHIDNTCVNQWIFYFSDYTYVIVHGGFYNPGYGPEIEEMGTWYELQTAKTETATE